MLWLKFRSNAVAPITNSAATPTTPNNGYCPVPLAGSARPGRHSTVSTIRIGYSATQLNTYGAINPAEMPPIMPPAEIHI